MEKYIIEMEDIWMIFNKTIIANKKVNFKVKEGEIHALVGENGAGKSTLMSILFGIYQQTKGIIRVKGKEEIISNPIKANRLGIGMVHQHFKMVEIFSLWENIALGAEFTKLNEIIDTKKIKTKIAKIMNRYNLRIDLDKKTSNASVGSKQKAEILKILYRDVDILVFDEPTAVLTPQEIDGLLEIMLELQKNGKTIIFITHKMAEIKKVANRATVIRRGEVIGTYDMKKTSIDQLTEAMVGRKVVATKNNYESKTDNLILQIKNLTMKQSSNNKVIGLNDFNLDVYGGEIVAIAGVEGNGQQEIAEAISGMEKITSGSIIMNGADITNENISSRYSVHKIGYVPEDRHKHGVVLDFNVSQNTVLQDIDDPKFSSKKFINFSAIQSYAQNIIQKFDIRNAEAGFAITRQLSGGNQQKVILGRELSRETNFLLIFQPTRGLDVGSIEFIHSQILKAKKEGRAILLISYELSEVLALADRIVVVNAGQKIGEISGKNAKKETIGKMMLGEKN